MKIPVAAFGFFVRSPCRLLLAGSIVVVANVYGAVTNTPADSQVPPLDPAALDNWQVRFSSSPNFIRRVLSSPKGYVAVGVGGTILTSAEGAVWIPRSSGTNVELSGVAFDGGTFVVVGFGGTILTSTDGITWTRRPSPTNAELYCVASSGNGQFVAAGSGGFVLLSSDSGATWQVANSGTYQVFLGLTFGQGKFVLTGAAGAIRVSTNGTDWIAASVSGLGGVTARDIWNAVYGSRLFVAVNAGGAILTSRDGLSWTNQMVPAVNNRPLVGVTYANDTFVCGGFNGALFSSVDGMNWTPHRFPGNPVDFLWAFASDGQTLVAADNGNSNLLMQSDTFYLSPPRIVIQPRDTVVRIGGTTNLNVGVMGTSPFNYHWRQGETPLPQATNQTLVFSNVPASADGVYDVTVGNPVGTNMSQTASLQVGLPPTIVLQPLDQEATPGATVTFSVEMSGTPPFNYGWRRPPSVYTTFEGQGRQSFWTVTNAGAAQVGVYGVVITNEYGSIISRPAQLTMAADVDGDGLPDTWELEQALNPGDPSDANRDADGDGLTNLQEYDSGTSPTNSASVLRLQSTLTGGALSLTFEAAPGKTYTILRRETIDAGFWIRWLDFAARTNARIETVVDPVGPTSRFYRVVTPRQP